jgi:cytidylate kinase
MPVITISRGSYSSGKAVAEEVARRLDCDCVSRDIEIETLETFDIPEAALSEAINTAPSILDRFLVRKEVYLSYYAAVLLKHLQRDNVVYHGLAGRFFVEDVPHVLKVRIITEMEYRAELAMEGRSLSREKALRKLRDDDEARRRWSRHFFGFDTNDPYLYDLVIQVNRISIDDAAAMICDAARLERFQATAESQRTIDNLALAANIRAEIIKEHPRAVVNADDGVVRVHVATSDPRKLAAAEKRIRQMPGVRHFELETGGEIRGY